MTDEANELVARWKEGDEQAAAEIYDRYVLRLVNLTRRHMSGALGRRVDAEDVVMSAYQSFFRQAKDDRYVLERSGDLWRLLVGITMNKLRSAIEFHSAGKRAFDAEESIRLDPSQFRLMPQKVDKEPTPAEAVSLLEQLAAVTEGMDPLTKEIFERRLAGESIEEIAEGIQRSTRTVRRLLERVRSLLEERLLGTLPE